MANKIDEMIDGLVKSKSDFDQKKDLFVQKISNTNTNSDEKQKYHDAFNTTRVNLRQGGQLDSDHILLPYIDDTYKQIKTVKTTINTTIDLVNIVEDMIKRNFAINNNIIKVNKKKYENANSKYKSKIDLNSATQVLKIDTYDRNIEENFFIMYYLISYGVISYFMYKLLKLQ
jgi:hypothetical protein